jgi:tetratricopeptide (TPR) repeat protein
LPCSLLVACVVLAAGCQSAPPAEAPKTESVAAAPPPPPPLSNEEALSLIERARVEKAAGRFEESLKIFSDVIDRNPNVGQPGVIYSERGEVYQSLQRFEEALADYTKALELNQHRDLYLRRVNIANAMGRMEVVEQDLALLQKTYPRDPVVRQLAQQVAASRKKN